jgi:hypothetical protein
MSPLDLPALLWIQLAAIRARHPNFGDSIVKAFIVTPAIYKEAGVFLWQSRAPAGAKNPLQLPSRMGDCCTNLSFPQLP